MEKREFSRDKLRINFLKHPVRSLRILGMRYFHENSRIGKVAIERPGSWKSLDLIYGNEPERIEPGTFVPGFWADRMFFDSGAAKATRMRLRKYVEEMKSLGKEYAVLNKGRVRILSLASGPGRDVMEAVEFLMDLGIDVYATCVDKCPDAIELGSRIAESRGASRNIIFERKKFGKLNYFEDGNRYDIVITQGIMDYLSDEDAKSLLENARNIINREGTLITSNMNNHRWIRFWMEFFGEWRLKYRNGNELSTIIKKSGYEDVVVYLLPAGYHWMGVGKTPKSN